MQHGTHRQFRSVFSAATSTEWIKPDNAKVESGDWINGTKIHTLRWHGEQAGLSCEMQLTEYQNFPALSWTVSLKNNGSANTAPIRDFNALDTYWKRTDGSMPILYRSQGSDGRTDDFVYVGEDMRRSMWSSS